MKLDKAHIQFIDNYLENSEVRYIDIRSEMVDHVASGIEEKMNAGDRRDFYYVFKDYMVQNKRLLIDNNKKYIKATDKKLIKLLMQELLLWPCVLIFTMLFSTFYFLEPVSEISVLKTWFGGLPLMGFVLFGLGYFIALRVYKLERFSAIERLGFIFAMAFNIFHFVWNTSHSHLFNLDNTVVYLLVSVALTLLIAMVKVSITLTKQYQHKYQSAIK